MLNRTNTPSKQPIPSMKALNESYLTDDTGEFIADNWMIRKQAEKQKQMFREVLENFRDSVPQVKTVNSEDNEKLNMRIAELEKELQLYKIKQPDIDRVITDLNQKEQQQAMYVHPICERHLYPDPAGEIENNILNPLITRVLFDQGRNIKSRRVPNLLKKLYGMTYTQSGGRTFYVGYSFNPQTYHEIEPYIREIVAERDKKKNILHPIQSTAPANSPRSPVSSGATSPAPVMMNRQ